MCFLCQAFLIIICCFVLQAISQRILIGFVDQLEINEPEDHREKDEHELGRGQYTECKYGVPLGHRPGRAT